ncbi:mechanosensitive ion channel domain-containing protein [Pseudodesulfovibrio sp. zrk46]|uniref:mechanosensitive ion channel family protein n=1 Tax=Pseudodesulfovibrio sp. zrk46 TaxID=2725288 RepID=UPI001449446E|nr:mechanosensitive ion channel domain-containing protein [Pseudodesulfovibrio sp. zrk46]QJB56317.1 mechanosensitive ion channel [Pseudodesulfovibrio sp. zrk46]
MQIDFDKVISYLSDWLNTNVLTVNTAIQWACVFGAYLFGLLLWRGFEGRLFRKVDESVRGELAKSILKALIDIGNIAGFIVLMQIAGAVFRALDMTPRLLDAASDLAVAWIIIRLLTSIMPNRSLARSVSLTVWAVAALHVFGLLAPITDFLESLKFSTGDISITALGVIKGVALAGVCLQIASLASQFATQRIYATNDLSPSIKVLLEKVVKVSLFTVAILFALSSVGIDLTSLAIFSSALGVGIGFGLKTIISNYIAGVLLLLDNSIKPGDTIEVGNVFGVVRNLHGRYTSVLTRSGKEHLIPNELLMTDEVVNWTFTDTNVRLKIPVGISYDSDVEKALDLLVEATKGVKRVLTNPAPAPRLVDFADNSVNLQLRIWIADAEKGVTNVRSEVMLNIWRLYHEHGIEFPFPQRDVLLKPESTLSVKLEKGESDD